MNFTVAGHGDFEGTFHFFKTPAARPRVEGHVHQPGRGRERLALPGPPRLGAVDATDRLPRSPTSTTGLYGGTARFDYRMEPLGRPGEPTQVVWDVEYTDVDLAQLTDFLETAGHPARRARHRPQPPRVAARQVGAEARRRRGDRDDAARA